jgi:hypothetical protein
MFAVASLPAPSAEKATQSSQSQKPKSEVRSPKSKTRSPQSAIRNPQSKIQNPKSVVRLLPGDYLTDFEKDYFQGKISCWAYFASPLFIGGNPATENLSYWDRVDYELIFFRNMPLSGHSIAKDIFVDWWRETGCTWYGQIYKHGIQEWRTARGWRNMVLGIVDGPMDGAHQLFDAVKTVDGHFKLPPHPGCTYEGGTRFVSWIFNKGLVEQSKPVKPVYYTLHPTGWILDLNAKGWNAGYLIGIKICKWPPMLAEGLSFGVYDLVTFREHRGEFRGKLLPFSLETGCAGYIYEADMNYRRGPEKAPSKPPRKVKKAE